MALIRWEPAAELNTLQTEMNRLFNTFFDQPSPAGRSGAPNRRWIPAMDLVETADHYILRADLPGVSDDDISVQLEDNVLTISGEREAHHDQKEEGYHRIERGFGTFARSLTLPPGVDPNGLQAHSERGVLEIRIPKPEQKKPRQIQITPGTPTEDAETIESTATADPQANGRDAVPAPA
jgi:HSP20 family protein